MPRSSRSPGAQEHGLRYAREALARGAAIVLYEPSAVYAATPPQPSLAVPNLKSAARRARARVLRDAAGEPTLIGVTGTNGKTTVAYLARAGAELSRSARAGTSARSAIGVPPKLTPHALTTPDTFTLHRELAELGAPRVAMEVSSHALAQERDRRA